MVKYGCIGVVLLMMALTAYAQAVVSPGAATLQTHLATHGDSDSDLDLDSNVDNANDDDASLQADMAAAKEVEDNTATLQGDISVDFDRD